MDNQCPCCEREFGPQSVTRAETWPTFCFVCVEGGCALEWVQEALGDDEAF